MNTFKTKPLIRIVFLFFIFLISSSLVSFGQTIDLGGACINGGAGVTLNPAALLNGKPSFSASPVTIDGTPGLTVSIHWDPNILGPGVGAWLFSVSGQPMVYNTSDTADPNATTFEAWTDAPGGPYPSCINNTDLAITGTGTNTGGGMPSCITYTAPVGTTNTWMGCADSDWTNGANWSTGVAPTASDVIYVPNNPDNPLVIDGVVTCSKLVVEIGGVCKVDYNAGGKLNVQF